MEMISWECMRCGHPLIPYRMVRSRNKWMSYAVAMDMYKKEARGRYDGYGRLKPKEKYSDVVHLNKFYLLEIWHMKCWNAASKPVWSFGSEKAMCAGVIPSECSHNWLFPPPPNDGKFRGISEEEVERLFLDSQAEGKGTPTVKLLAPSPKKNTSKKRVKVQK